MNRFLRDWPLYFFILTIIVALWVFSTGPKAGPSRPPYLTVIPPQPSTISPPDTSSGGYAPTMSYLLASSDPYDSLYEAARSLVLAQDLLTSQNQLTPAALNHLSQIWNGLIYVAPIDQPVVNDLILKIIGTTTNTSPEKTIEVIKELALFLSQTYPALTSEGILSFLREFLQALQLTLQLEPAATEEETEETNGLDESNESVVPVDTKTSEVTKKTPIRSVLKALRDLPIVRDVVRISLQFWNATVGRLLKAPLFQSQSGRPASIINRDLYIAQHSFGGHSMGGSGGSGGGTGGRSSSLLDLAASDNAQKEGLMWDYINNAKQKIVDATGLLAHTAPVQNLINCLKQFVYPGRINYTGVIENATAKSIILWMLDTGALKALKTIQDDKNLKPEEKEQRTKDLISYFCNNALGLSGVSVADFQKAAEQYVTDVYTKFVPAQPQVTAAAVAPVATPATTETKVETKPVEQKPVEKTDQQILPEQLPLKLNEGTKDKAALKADPKAQAITFIQTKILQPMASLDKRTVGALADYLKKGGQPGFYGATTQKAVKTLQQFLMAWGKKNKPDEAAVKDLNKAGPTGNFDLSTYQTFILYVQSLQAAKK